MRIINQDAKQIIKVLNQSKCLTDHLFLLFFIPLNIKSPVFILLIDPPFCKDLLVTDKNYLGSVS